MSKRSDTLISLVEPYGVSRDEAAIYVMLLEMGESSALDISRGLKMGRTKVYRILDGLIEKGLVVQVTGPYGFKFEASSPTKLEMMVKLKEKEVEGLKTSIPDVVRELSSLGGGKSGAKVVYFEGKSGLEQITYNSLAAKDEILIYEQANMAAFMEQNIAEQIRRELVKKKIFVRQLTNMRKYPAWTEVKEAVKLWELRYVPAKTLKFKFDWLIYNQVYALYTFEEKKVFGVEIYSEALAEMQRQLFEFVWKGAKRMKVVSEGGEARV